MSLPLNLSQRLKAAGFPQDFDLRSPCVYAGGVKRK